VEEANTDSWIICKIFEEKAVIFLFQLSKYSREIIIKPDAKLGHLGSISLIL
jgi:hypothetical protein